MNDLTEKVFEHIGEGDYLGVAIVIAIFLA